jgi:hypothetical protein
MKPTGSLSRIARSLAATAVLSVVLGPVACRSASAGDAQASASVPSAQATVIVDGLQCPSLGSGVRIVRGDLDICPASVDQVLSEQDPAEVPLSLALMGGAMLGVLFMSGRRR